MVAWHDLTGQEQAALVGAALSANRQREVNAYAWQHDTVRYPYVHLHALQLIAMVRRSRSTVTYTITPQAVTLLLSAPDDADGQRVFPTTDDISLLKCVLRTS